MPAPYGRRIYTAGAVSSHVVMPSVSCAARTSGRRSGQANAAWQRTRHGAYSTERRARQATGVRRVNEVFSAMVNWAFAVGHGWSRLVPVGPVARRTTSSRVSLDTVATFTNRRCARWLTKPEGNHGVDWPVGSPVRDFDGSGICEIIRTRCQCRGECTAMAAITGPRRAQG